MKKTILITSLLTAAFGAQCFVGLCGAAEVPTAAAAVKSAEDLTLDDVQDAGICLYLIRRAAINIYREAARTAVTPGAKPDIPEINTIPLAVTGKKLLPPRRRWLLFFLTSMEPVIRDLGTESSKTEQGLNPIIPADLKPVIEPMWNNWSKSIADLNHHLDVLLPLIDDAPHNNTKIQAVAVDIFKDVNALELQRKKIFTTLEQIEQQNPGEKIKVNHPDER